MKVLVTGAKGQLGRTLLARQPDGISVIGVDLDTADITDAEQVNTLVAEVGPDVIVNAAAYTAVDLAETNEDEARRVNVDGPRYLAGTGKRLIQVSTDFVFDGRTDTPYAPDASTNPLGAYARSKLDGEVAVREMSPENSVVLRTAWLYSEYGGNFVETMLRLMREREELAVVNDQVGSPTWATSVADAIYAMVARPDISGTYHWTDAGQASWFDFACAIQREAHDLGQLEKTIAIRPIPTSDYPVAAKRPAFSVLDCTMTMETLGLTQTPWRKSLRKMLEVLST